MWTSTGCKGMMLIICIFSFGINRMLYFSSNCSNAAKNRRTLFLRKKLETHLLSER